MYQCTKCGKKQSFNWISANCVMGGSCIVVKLTRTFNVPLERFVKAELVILIK